MNDNLAWYFGGGNWYDRRLRGQIEELEESVSGAYAQSSRLRSQLAQVQGDLGSKVARMARAFDAFVELSDIRNELAVFTGAAIVRHQARQLLGSVAAGRTPVPPEPPAVPGYWLVPATRALYARLSGDTAEAARQAEAAVELDGERARLFLAAATRLTGPVDLPAAELHAVLPAGPGPVPWGRRMLWLATAQDAFGPAGRELLASALTRALTETLGPPAAPGSQDTPAGDGAEPRGFAAWVAAVSHQRTDPAGVATALADVRTRLTAIPGLTTGPAGVGISAREGGTAGAASGVPAEVGGAAGAGAGVPAEVGGPAGAGTTATSSAAAGADGGGAGGAVAVVGPLAEVVRVLVDEGAPEERELLRRAVELRAVIEDGTAPPPYRACDEPVGGAGELVLKDVLTSDEVAVPVRAAAARVALPWLRAAVDRAVAAVPVTEPPRASTLRIWETDITVTAAGPDAATLDAARARIATEYRPRRTQLVVGAVLAGAGLLVALAGFAVSPLLVVLGALVMAAGLITVVVGLRRNAGMGTQHADYLVSVDRRITDEMSKLQQATERSAAGRDQVERERAALAETLAPAPGV
jgi:hypothetical protein